MITCHRSVAGIRRCRLFGAIVVTAIALAACDDPIAPRWVADGEWAYTMEVPYFSAPCTTSGNLVIAPAEQSTFTVRSGNCDVVSGAIAHLAASDTANEITFRSPNCAFSGAAVAGDSIAGFVDCDIGFGVHRNGTWAAGRVGPAARIEIAPSTRGYAVGTTQNLTVSITDARGRPLYGRVPWWATSNTAVAKVTPDDFHAVLQAGAVGTAIVSASYASLADSITVHVSMPVFAAITSGSHYSCAITVSGAPWCWGRNTEGQLGDGTTEPALGPVRAQGELSFSMLDAGHQHACGVSAARVYCWGDNRFGQLGVGDAVNRSAPALVSGAGQFEVVRSGSFHSCGLATNGVPWCWGDNTFGQLGDGDALNRAAPVALSDAPAFRQLSAGGLHSCALTAAGDAWCWGSNGTGSLGNGSLVDPQRRPAQVVGGHAFSSIDASAMRTCALDASGSAYCWGFKHHGLFDIGPDSIARAPVAAAPGRAFTVLRTGVSHTCGLDADGAAWCWGANWYGQLGDGTTINRAEPTRVVGGRTFRDINVGSHHSCAIATSGVVYCWGGNESGQLGDGGTENRTSPVRVAGQP